jgi:hypothetical protein
MRAQQGFSGLGLTMFAGAAALAALLGAPRTQQARASVTEAAVITDLRQIVAAARAYAASNRAFPTTLSGMGQPTVVGFPIGTPPFLDPLRGAVLPTPGVIGPSQFNNHGYTFTYQPGVGGRGLYDYGAATFSLKADPLLPGQSGYKYFGTDKTGLICVKTDAPFPNDGVSLPQGCLSI